MTMDEAVDELQIILDNYEQIRHNIENKMFIREKIRRWWLKDHQQAIDALYMAIEALKQSQTSADTWFDPEDETLVMQRILQREEDMRNIADDNFEPWLPNSRNQRCILPLMNLMLKDDAEGVGK